MSNVNDSTKNTGLRILPLGESTIAGVGVHTHTEGFSGSLGDEL